MFNKVNVKLAKGEQRILDYLVHNSQEAINMSLKSIAQEVNVAPSSITRLAQKLGYDGFLQLRLAIAMQLKDSQTNDDLDLIDYEESFLMSQQKILKNNVNVLQATLDNIATVDIKQVIRLLLSKKRISIIGLGYSSIAAMDASYRLARIGLNVNVISDTHNIVMKAAISNSDDLVIALSDSGLTNEISYALNLASSNQAATVLITNAKYDANNNYDVILTYASHDIMPETGSLVSKMAQMLVIELLYTEIVKSNPTYYNRIQRETTNAINEYSKINRD
ncbi:MAG: MurR/RpiR family transcriptional regulator [Bacilli bacterium]